MSDIIPFPKAAQKLKKEIQEAQRNQNYETMYELIATYESHFELDEQLAMIKCELLFKMESFLELREETLVLLKSGVQQYDALMLYYVKSLIGLHQYFEATEVISQIIDEVKSHKTRMELFPLKEYAQSQLLQDQQQVVQQLGQFEMLNNRERTKLVFKLIDNGHYQFKDTVAHLLNTLSIQNNLSSLMLEYLRFVQYTETINLTKFGYDITVVPAKLKGLEHTLIKETIIPRVISALEDGALNITIEAHHIMNNHSILLYPLDIGELFDENEWVNAYEVYFKGMIGIEVSLINQKVLDFIEQLDTID